MTQGLRVILAIGLTTVFSGCVVVPPDEEATPSPSPSGAPAVMTPTPTPTRIPTPTPTVVPTGTPAPTPTRTPTPTPTRTPTPSPLPSSTPVPTPTPGPTSTPGAGATYYISPSGNDSRTATQAQNSSTPWKTLYKASSSVSTPGAVIKVLAGTYNETQRVSLAVGVSIDGAGVDVSIIKSNIADKDFSDFIVLDSPQDTNGNQSISNLTIDGQYVSSTNYKTWWGIRVTGRSNVSIHHTKIINFWDRGVIFDGNDADSPYIDPGHHATGNKFYNNTILNSAQNNGNYGSGLLNIGGQLGMLIHDNTLIQDQRPNFKNGWPIKYWDNGWLKGVKIYNNTLIKAPYQGTSPGQNGDWDFAVEIFNASGLEFYNNAVQGSLDINYNLKGSYAFSAWIHHNVINHSVLNTHYESGMIFEFFTESMLIENNIVNNASSAIQFNTRTPTENGGYPNPGGGTPVGGFSRLTNNVIRNNLFSNIYNPTGCCGGGGIMIVSEFERNDAYIRNLDIYNNTLIAKSGNPPWVAIDLAAVSNGSAMGINIRNNIVMGFPDSWLKGSNSGATGINGIVVTHNNAFNNGSGNVPVWPAGNPQNYTYGSNLSVDPKFISATDFHLQSSSPVIDKGVNVGLPYLGNAPDIGAYEKQ